MKILNADKHKYIPRQMLIEKIKYGNGFRKGGAFYLPMFKGDSLSVRPSGDGLKEVLSTAAGAVGTIADVVSGGAKIVKSLTGGGIEADALNAILQTETQPGIQTKATLCSLERDPCSSLEKTGSGFYIDNNKK